MKLVPYKRAEGDGRSFGKALKAYTNDNYRKAFAQGDMKEVESAIDQVAAMRERALVISNAAEGDFNPETAIEVFGQYYMVLVELKRRFPFKKFKSGIFSSTTPSVMIELTWHDALRPEKIHTGYEIDCEISAVLFNLAAAFSQAANHCDRTNSEGLKQSARYFMQSSGAFLHTQGSVEVSATQDISVAATRWLSQMMYSQGCACTFENAITKKMKPKIVAQLALGAADQFDQSLALIEENESIKRWVTKSKKKFDLHCIFQSLCLRAAGQFWFAKLEIASENYGAEIARLRRALQFCSEAESIEARLGRSRALRESRTQLEGAISARLREAEKDNETIYYALIPHGDELDPIKSKSLGKPVEPEIPPWQYPAIFDRLVPNDIMEKVEEFKSQADEKLQRMKREANEATEFGRAMMASMNLPAALEAVEFASSLPPDLWSKISEIQGKGAMEYLNQLKVDISENSTACYDQFDDTARLLDEEMDAERHMRSLYGVKWNRSPSEEVASEYHHHLNEARRFLQQAGAADGKIEKMLGSSEEVITKLAMSKADLEETLPDGSADHQSQESDSVRQALDALSDFFEERERLLKEFEQTLEEVEVSSIFMSVPKHEISGSFRGEMKQFDNFERDINDNVKKQPEFIARVTEANEAWTRSKQNSATVSERERILHEMNQAVDTYRKIEKRLVEGRKFYLDLLANHLQPLHQTVSGFVAARNAELKMLEEDLRKSRNGGAHDDYDDDDNDGGYRSPPTYF